MRRIAKKIIESMRSYRDAMQLRHRLSRQDRLKVIVGSSGLGQSGWVPTDYPLIDFASDESLRRFFIPSAISALIAEHVWEHLTIEQARLAAHNCFLYLKPGGYIRVAVPDGNHPDQGYIDQVKPGGSGPGADDHKVLYTYDSLSKVFASAGFSVSLLEGFDNSGVFHSANWDPADGLIKRSARFDDRNADNPHAYTSLIIDAVKPL